MSFFSEYDFVITYRPAAQHGKADGLSSIGGSKGGITDDVPPIIPDYKIIGAEEHTTKTFLELLKYQYALIPAEEWKKNPLHSIKEGLYYHDDKLYIPISSLQRQILEWCHDSALAGHPGDVKTARTCKMVLVGQHN